MYIVKAEADQVEKIVDMSIRAFETDVNVGGVKGDCPPGFDSIEWHRQMTREGHLYQAMIKNDLVGAAIVFPDETKKSVYIGRIFIDSVYHRKGYGIRLMECIEENFPWAAEFNLDTPCWNERTNAFYKRLGYRIIRVEDGFAFYQKRNGGPDFSTMTEKMISWAEDRIGCTKYAGWCLAFIEDALEISNDIEIFGGDSAKESCEMYRDALRGGAPERGSFVFYDCLCPSENGPVNWGHCGISLGNGNVIHAWDVVRVDNYLDIENMTALSGDHPRYIGWVPIERVLVQKPCKTESHIIETQRLYLRQMRMDDFDALYAVLADSDIMRHYPYAFDEARVQDWIERNMNRYRKDGFGLWAVCPKETGGLIGDCGLTLQNIHGEILPEIGYHIRRDCQRKGYAGEAAKAVRDWAFRNSDYPTLYSYCKYTNVPSIKTAESIGMHFVCEYPDETNGTTHVSAISREEWLDEIAENTVC